MSNKAHTPGPWHVGVTPSGKKAARVHAPDGSVVADVGGLIYDNPDAALIAAAPAMLAALKDTLQYLNAYRIQHDNDPGAWQIVEQTEAAIAEAGGESR